MQNWAETRLTLSQVKKSQREQGLCEVEMQQQCLFSVCRSHMACICLCWYLDYMVATYINLSTEPRSRAKHQQNNI